MPSNGRIERLPIPKKKRGAQRVKQMARKKPQGPEQSVKSDSIHSHTKLPTWGRLFTTTVGVMKNVIFDYILLYNTCQRPVCE